MRVVGAVGSICFALLLAVSAPAAAGQPGDPVVRHGGEASLVLPDLGQVEFLGFSGRTSPDVRPCRVRARSALRARHLQAAQGDARPRVDARGLRADLRDVQDLPDPRRESSSCCSRSSSASIIVFYFGVLQRLDAMKVAIILIFSLIGIAGSYGVAWFGIRINTFANSRTAFAGPAGPSLSHLCHPAEGGHEHRDAPHQRRAVPDAVHPAVHPRRLRRTVLHRLCDRRVARRSGAAHRRRYLHEDCRHRLGPDEDRLQHQGRRCAQPWCDRRLHGRQRGRFGRTERGRIRDLRRHRRRADHLHPSGRAERTGAGPAARLDLHDAGDDDRRERCVVPRERGLRPGAVRRRRQDELRGAADVACLAHLDRVGRPDLPRVLSAHPESG